MAGTDFGDERDEIISDFIVETEELIERLDQELVQLEENASDLALLNSIFRAAHTIKGTSSFLGFTRMTELTHKAENVLDKLRNQEFSVSSEIMDALLDALDGIKTLLEEIREGRGGEEDGYDPSPTMQVLISIVQNGGVVGDVIDVDVHALQQTSQADAEAAMREAMAAAQPSPPTQSAEAADASLDDILASAPAVTPNVQLPASKAAAGGASSELDDILASAPAVTPNVQLPASKAAAGGDSSELDDILASAAVTPNVQLPGTQAAAGGDSSELDDILASAPAVTPNVQLPGTQAAAGGASSELDDILASAPAVSPKVSLPPSPQKPAAAATSKPAAPKPAASPQPSGAAAAKQSLAEDAAAAQAAGKVPVPMRASTKLPAKPAAAGAAKNEAVAVEQTIRVDVERLDALMNLAGELVLGRNRLANITRELEALAHEAEAVQELANVVQSISLVAGNLQMAVMKTRMLPIGKVFNRFPRMVRDLAREKKKLVDLRIVGGDTEVDKSVIEAIGDPLVHLIRNSVDHGIESPEVRLSRDKPETGSVELSAMHQGNHVVITITDDGNGMDVVRLKEIALKRGVVDESQLSRMSDKEVRLLIFQPGFSTAAVVTNTSGRGVGMDVVKTNVERLGGTIDIESEVGVGTKMAIKLPLTLAIIQALMVKAHDETYAVSLANVMETVRVPKSRIQTVEGHEVVQLRDRVVPVIKLAEVLDCPTFVKGKAYGETDQIYIVVLGLGEQRVGLAVERLLGQEEVVIKSLGEYLHSVQGIAGSTILGDGRVALIVDVASLMSMIYGTPA